MTCLLWVLVILAVLYLAGVGFAYVIQAMNGKPDLMTSLKWPVFLLTYVLWGLLDA